MQAWRLRECVVHYRKLVTKTWNVMEDQDHSSHEYGMSFDASKDLWWWRVNIAACHGLCFKGS